jgi:hypothetical protein
MLSAEAARRRELRKSMYGQDRCAGLARASVSPFEARQQQ